MGFLPLVECHAFLPEGLSVGNSWYTTCSWDLNQASCSWPTSGDLTRHLQACAGGLGQIVPDPAFLFVVLLSSNDWRKWVNSAFRKTPLFKNYRCERLSLLYISKVEIYNPLSALLLTLVCHFYYVLLRVAIFVLIAAIATYFERRQKELSTKTLLWKIYRGKVVQIFTAQPLHHKQARPSSASSSTTQRFISLLWTIISTAWRVHYSALWAQQYQLATNICASYSYRNWRFSFTV